MNGSLVPVDGNQSIVPVDQNHSEHAPIQSPPLVESNRRICPPGSGSQPIDST